MGRILHVLLSRRHCQFHKRRLGLFFGSESPNRLGMRDEKGAKNKHVSRIRT